MANDVPGHYLFAVSFHSQRTLSRCQFLVYSTAFAWLRF